MNAGTSPGTGTTVVSGLANQLAWGGVLFFGPALLLAVFTAAGAPAHWQLVALLAVMGTSFLGLGVRSRLEADEETITVCFFGLRSSTVAWRDVVAATYFMAFPSISFAVTLRTRSGQRMLVHWYWWRKEREIAHLMATQLLRYGAEFDEVTASIVSRELRVPPPLALLKLVPVKVRLPAYVAAHPREAALRVLAATAAILILVALIVRPWA